jgi:hypothetical protein
MWNEYRQSVRWTLSALLAKSAIVGNICYIILSLWASMMNLPLPKNPV